MGHMNQDIGLYSASKGGTARGTHSRNFREGARSNLGVNLVDDGTDWADDWTHSSWRSSLPPASQFNSPREQPDTVNYNPRWSRQSVQSPDTVSRIHDQLAEFM